MEDYSLSIDYDLGTSSVTDILEGYDGKYDDVSSSRRTELLEIERFLKNKKEKNKNTPLEETPHPWGNVRKKTKTTLKKQSLVLVSGDPEDMNSIWERLPPGRPKKDIIKIDVETLFVFNVVKQYTLETILDILASEEASEHKEN